MEINEMTTVERRWIIQALNPKGEARIIFQTYNIEEEAWEYGRTHQCCITDGSVIRKISEKYAYEALSDMRRDISWEFDSENPNPRGWEAPTIRKLQGLHSFSVTKTVTEVYIDIGFIECDERQPNCNPEREII